jgi:hypothetical protein
MLPLPAGEVPQMTAFVTADRATTLTVELRRSSKPLNHTPDVTLESLTIPVSKGHQAIDLPFNCRMDEPGYVFVTFLKNNHIQLQYSQLRVSGVLSVFNKINPAVSNYGKQEPTEDIGVDTFEFWCPERRPKGQNIALQIKPAIRLFSPGNVTNGTQRPTNQPNAWVADLNDPNPTLTLTWPSQQRFGRVELYFDTDFDHPLETVIMIHPETVSPFCVQEYTLCNDRQERIFHQTDNHQTNCRIRFEKPIESKSLTLHLKRRTDVERACTTPVALMEIRCYQDL